MQLVELEMRKSALARRRVVRIVIRVERNIFMCGMVEIDQSVMDEGMTVFALSLWK